MPDHSAIDDATADDVERVVELWTDLVEHGRAYGLTLRSDANRLVAREVLAAAVGDDRVLVARAGTAGEQDESADGRVVGFCSLALETGGFERDSVRGVVENLYVEPAARGEGLGSALLETAEERLAERGAGTVAVEAMVADDAVRSFYRDRGFEERRVTLAKRVE